MPDTSTLLIVWCGVLSIAVILLSLIVKSQSEVLALLAQGMDEADAKIASLLARTDRRAMSDEAATVEEWRAAADAAPEGSPKRDAYMNRLRELGAL